MLTSYMKFNHIRFPDKVDFPPLKNNHICHITPASMTLGVLFIINTYFTPHRVFFCHLARESPFTPKWVVNLCANVDPTELPSPTMKELYISSHVTSVWGRVAPASYLRKWYFWCCNHKHHTRRETSITIFPRRAIRFSYDCTFWPGVGISLFLCSSIFSFRDTVKKI